MLSALAARGLPRIAGPRGELNDHLPPPPLPAWHRLVGFTVLRGVSVWRAGYLMAHTAGFRPEQTSAWCRAR